MKAKQSESVSTYLQYLPAILQEDVFIGQFLLAFEKILSGLDEIPSQEKIISAETQNLPGLEEIIDRIHLYFDPQATPEEFLPWLAGWVALSLRDDWKPEVKKAFIQQIVGLYRLRGTKAGLTKILEIYLENAGFGKKVEVFDRFDNFPNYFQVRLTLDDRNPDRYWRQAKIAQAIIDREKPAQTFYSLKILVPTMQITQPSSVAYPFKLFEPIIEQSFTIEVTIVPDENNNNSIARLAKHLFFELQGSSKEITINSAEIIVDNKSFSIKYELDYQDFADNLAGFNVKLSNQTDEDFVGDLLIKLYFTLNNIEHSTTLRSEQLNLSPVLKICQINSEREVSEGNTIFTQANSLERSGMKITEYVWSDPYEFKTFTPPKIQKFQPEIKAIIETIELEATVEITSEAVTKDILNKIIVRFKDNVSDLHLFTPKTKTEDKKITIQQRFNYQHFQSIQDTLSVAIANLNNPNIEGLNNSNIEGTVTINAYLEVNRNMLGFQLLKQDFFVAATVNKNILQICRKPTGSGAIEKDKIPTVLGTTTQSLI